MRLLKKHVKWFWDRMGRDRLDSTAAHSSFFLIISFLPFLALLFTLMQHIRFSDGYTIIEMGLNALPKSVAEYLEGMLPSPLESNGVLPVAIIMTAWSSSMGMVAIVKGLDQIYDAKGPRNYVALRLMALLYVILFAVVLMITAALLVFGSTIYKYLLDHSPQFFATLLMNFKSLVGFVLLVILFTLMFTFLPRRRIKFIHNLAGAAFAAAGWVLFSFFFSLFVENFSNFSIYGGLATLVILMFWLFFCMYIMFLGAEVSMWLEVSGIQNDLKNRAKKRKKQKARKAMKQEASERHSPEQHPLEQHSLKNAGTERSREHL